MIEDDIKTVYENKNVYVFECLDNEDKPTTHISVVERDPENDEIIRRLEIVLDDTMIVSDDMEEDNIISISVSEKHFNFSESKVTYRDGSVMIDYNYDGLGTFQDTKIEPQGDLFLHIKYNKDGLNTIIEASRSIDKQRVNDEQETACLQAHLNTLFKAIEETGSSIEKDVRPSEQKRIECISNFAESLARGSQGFFSRYNEF